MTIAEVARRDEIDGPFHLDSSVAVWILLGHSPAAAAWFDTTTAGAETTVESSRLLRTELTRVLRREGLPVAVREQILDYVGTIPLDHAVLIEAEAIVPYVCSFDAIHLGSALRSGIDELVIVTHDDTMRHVAQADGAFGRTIRWSSAERSVTSTGSMVPAGRRRSRHPR